MKKLKFSDSYPFSDVAVGEAEAVNRTLSYRTIFFSLSLSLFEELSIDGNSCKY